MKKLTIAGAAVLFLTATASSAQANVDSSTPVPVPAACTVKLSSYTTPGSTDSRAGVHNAMKAVEAKGGGTICVDGMYNIRNYIDLDTIARTADIAFVGTSTSGSGFRGTTNAPIFFQGDQTLRPEAKGNTSSPYRGQYRYNTIFSNMKLVKPAGTIGRIFDFRTGAQVNMTISNIQVDSAATGANNETIYFGRDVQAHGNLFTKLRIEQRAVNTSGVVKVVGAHNFFNNNQFLSITAYKFNNNGAPGFELRPQTGQYTNNSFRSITGQNMAGGFIHVYGQSGGGIYDSSNWDLAANTQYRDTIRVGKTAKSYPTNGYVLSGLGKVEEGSGQTAMMSGRHRIAVGTGSSNITVQGTSATPVYTNLTY